MTEASFYPCGAWEASKPRVASPQLPQPSGGKLYGCLRMKAHRNSPVPKKELRSILSVAATPKQDSLWMTMSGRWAGSPRFMSGFGNRHCCFYQL
ncbi:hypothetical protein CesoFtcFv8_009431 [Champsocephalus esox]|uniref:Uncharacterized protein n=1 Tax=Champsocephalus esox TaxID=159716 RepID=A0AAN8CCN5_9TELE|nr:hypothetical protein CesoFtcFv8_009431 [Champsocephalus esox]